jgi:excinuclease ABC subunit B
MKFKLQSNYKPAGDQPQAIRGLVSGLIRGDAKQALLGVTGSGKTFTVANVIEQTQKPTLVIAHNKTLAAQLCNEFREFFPDNAVEYFVSYYDYYQPEAYMPSSDTYIEKEAQINEEIDRLRHACTQALLTRKDVIIVASVSCIYGLGSPKEYEKIVLHLKKGDKLDRRAMLEQLVEMQFERVNADLRRGTFRMRGQVFEIMPVNEERVYRFEVSNFIEAVELVDSISRKVLKELEDTWFFPAKHYVASPESRTKAFVTIKDELKERLEFFQKKGKVLEFERLKRRVSYDLEMIKNIGYCNGIENYSRHFDGRVSGEPAFTLIDYFRECDKNFLTVIDESHVTVSQIGGMYFGDRSRKDTLVEHGFRLPSARDNRPLNFDEFEARVGRTLYVSATPGDYEKKESNQIVEQIVRPTGLVDPRVLVLPVIGRSSKEGNIPDQKLETINLKLEQEQQSSHKSEILNHKSGLSQIEDVIVRIQERIEKGERTLVTTLTKKMAEDLNDYLKEKGIKVKYLHSGIRTIERIEIITDLRKGEIDVIVGVNLLREGLDMPEVSLVAILDADKEGFLRSTTSLIQTIGRAARNVNGQVVLYADQMTGSMKRAIEETDRRREIQLAYNKKHGITPKTIEKSIKNILEEFGINVRNTKTTKVRNTKKSTTLDLDLLGDGRDVVEIIKDKEKKMKEAAKDLQFELATILRDEIRELKAREKVK